MDINDIISLGTKAFQEKIGGADGADSSVVTEALSGLFSNEEGGFDLGNIVSSVAGGGEGGIGSVVSSWLGDGENASVDGSQLTELLGSDKIAAFADKLGIDTDTALSGLTDAVPNIVDKASEGGSLMATVSVESLRTRKESKMSVYAHRASGGDRDNRDSREHAAAESDPGA